MKYTKKFLSLILAILMILSTFLVTALAATTTPGKVTESEALSRINELVNKFSNCYFTVDNKTGQGRSYTYANLSDVSQASWFVTKVGRGSLSYGNMAATRVYDGSKTSSWGEGGSQCYGFANFAHWYIFTSKNTDNIVSTAVFSGKTNYNNVKNNAKPGDILCTYKNSEDMHSMIYISCDSSGVTVLDANWANGTGSSIIQKHKIVWSDLSYYTYLCITRATNYDTTSSNISVTDVYISPLSMTLTVGDTKSLTATISPSNATNKAVTWSSTNTEVAAVSSSGVVTAKVPGTATIKVTTSDGGFVSSCIVTVNAKTYTISYDTNGGSNGPTNQIKEAGIKLTLSSSVPTRTGYTFKGWQVPSTIKKSEWSTTKPASGSYETGYKFYTWGCECKNSKNFGANYDEDDYTFTTCMTKEKAIQHIKDNPDYFGTYSPSLVRYFWKIESTKKGGLDSDGDWFYTVGKDSHVTVDYIGLNSNEELEESLAGSRSIWKTTFWFESEVYRWNDIIPGDIYQPGEIFNIDSDITLTAVWEESMPQETYTISFDANGGTGAPVTQSKMSGTTLKLPSMVPTRENYDFLYWFDGFVSYFPGDVYTADKSTVLKACWFPSWTPTVYIEDVEGFPGEGIGIPLCIENNLKDGEEQFNIYVNTTIGEQKVEWNFTEDDGELPEDDVFLFLMCTIPEDAEVGTEYSVNVTVNSFQVGPYDFGDTISVLNGKITVVECPYGDLNEDGKINVLDANIVRQSVAKMVTLNERQKAIADVNNDGSTDVIDANLIRRYTAHLIDKFSVEN